MKKILTLTIGMLSLLSIANAQKLGIGGKIGANLNKISGQQFKDGYNLGYFLGGFAEIDLNKKWGIQPEVLWNQVNTRHADNYNAITSSFRDSTGTIKLKYLTIPVLLRYNVGSMLTLNAGPQFGILLDQHQTLLKNGQNAFKNGDFSLVAGATINVASLRIYGRYNIGLSNISDYNKQDNWKSQQVQIGVGFRL
ncbi:MAG: PorT family protein [Bacteroidota bacterium]|nr:PorT family protein [Bacteroidota bacterium]